MRKGVNTFGFKKTRIDIVKKTIAIPIKIFPNKRPSCKVEMEKQAAEMNIPKKNTLYVCTSVIIMCKRELIIYIITEY